MNCRSALMCLHLQWCCCECWRHGENLFVFLTVSLSSQCALDRQKWAAGWGSSGRRKTTVRERFTPPSRDRRWRPRSGWTTRTTTWTSWWGKTVSCQLFSYLRWIHSDIKWLLKEMISRVRNVEVRIICEELLKGEIKPWHTEILQQRSLILCCSANPRSDDTCKWQTPNPLCESQQPGNSAAHAPRQTVPGSPAVDVFLWGDSQVSVICEAAAGEMLKPAGCEVANGGRSRGP